MTATNEDGNFVGTPSCADFTSSTGFSNGGLSNAGSGAWTVDTSSGCSGGIYCLGIDFNRPVNPPPASGRVAFMSTPWTIAGGLAGADAHCQGLANTNGLPAGTYRALLATTAASAASRFNLVGQPWIRRDGTPLAMSGTALMNGQIDAPITQFADGTYNTQASGNNVRTGASSPTVAAANAGETCNDWTSTVGNTSWRGYLPVTDSRWFKFGTAAYSCTAPTKIYCLQQ